MSLTNLVPASRVRSKTGQLCDRARLRGGHRAFPIHGARPTSHALRAESLAAAALIRPRSGIALALLLGLVACTGRGMSTDGTGQTAPPNRSVQEAPHPKLEVAPEARRAIEELVKALTPLRADLTSDILDRHYVQQRELMGRLRTSNDRAIGIAAIDAYVGYSGDQTLVRRGLLDIAAHAAPDESRDLLKTLMLEYGFPIDDRTYATEFLAQTSPELYLEIAKPYVERRGRPTKTMPNDEFLVRGWIEACARTGRSPVQELADVATNLQMEDAARHLAAEELGRHSDPRGRKALETLLVESTGNNYIRRKAAQSLQATLPTETACTLFTHVLQHEVDLNFAAFLQDMIARVCR